MKIDIDIDKSYKETTITIQTSKWSTELDGIVNYIQSKQTSPSRLFGLDNEQTILLEPAKIDYIYAAKRKVFAAIKGKRFEIRMKLYEAENLLASFQFMRFSKSVIGNLQNIERFELHFNGNLCVYFRSGNKEYINRKYVRAIKKKLRIGGDTNDT